MAIGDSSTCYVTDELSVIVFSRGESFEWKSFNIQMRRG